MLLCTVYTMPMPFGMGIGTALRSMVGPSTAPKTRPVSVQSLLPNSRTIKRIEWSRVARSVTTRGTHRLPLSSRPMQGLIAYWPAAEYTGCESSPVQVAAAASHRNELNSPLRFPLHYTRARVFPLNIPSSVEYWLLPGREG